LTSATAARDRFIPCRRWKRPGVGPVSRLPVSSGWCWSLCLRNCDGKRVSEAAVRALANWQPSQPARREIPFIVARIVLQDFTGVPLLVDWRRCVPPFSGWAKIRKSLNRSCRWILWWTIRCRWILPASEDAMQKNLEMEFRRNRERYQFLKWGMQAFDTFKVVPPGIGIVHQVNLEYSRQGRACSTLNQRFSTVLSGYTGRHGFAHNDDQWPRASWGGVSAASRPRPACSASRLFPHAGRRRRASHRHVARGRHRDRPRAQPSRKCSARQRSSASSSNFSVPARRRCGGGPRDHCEHGAEYGATMGFFPIDAECVKLSPRHGRSEELCWPAKITTVRRACSAFRSKATSPTRRNWN